MQNAVIAVLVVLGIIGHTILLTTHLRLQRQIDDLSTRLRRLEVMTFAEPPDADKNAAP